jgi:glycosyltransferase involved in cell wall biosynthesis
MKPLISIIIPVYNAERTLGACLDSVLAQTYTDIEVLCVVDGANDASADILYRYADRDPRVHVIGQESAGPATARNAGLAAAQGTYIGFVDADDRVAPEMFEKLHTAIEETEADLACCAHYSVGADGSEREVALDERFDVSSGASSGASMEVSTPQDLGLLLTRLPDFIWDKLYRRALIAREEIRFPDGRVYGEDTVFLAKYLRHTARVAFVRAPLYYYTAFSTGSITNTVSDAWYDIFENLKEILYDFGAQKELKPYLEELCIRYYDRRANAILRGGDRDFQLRYLRYSFEFLHASFPDWKARMRTLDGVAFARVKTSLPLMRLAMLAPASWKARAGERARSR